MPPSTPRLNTADWKPRSCTNQMSAMDAGTSASIGAMAKPCTARAAARDPKDLDSAAQKHETMSKIDVTMYTGRFPILTARVLQTKLDTAMATIQEPWRPRVNCCRGMSNCSARGASAAVSNGPTAV